MARIEGMRGRGTGFARVVFFALERKLGRVIEPMRVHARHKGIFRGYVRMETAQDGAGLVPTRLKRLAQVRAATRIGCPF